MKDTKHHHTQSGAPYLQLALRDTEYECALGGGQILWALVPPALA